MEPAASKFRPRGIRGSFGKSGGKRGFRTCSMIILRCIGLLKLNSSINEFWLIGIMVDQIIN